mmetsp:Transcript_21820/g.67454  ORF Transcript_21820/g.67454 Transcript_21820/m.67454 type:complete len:152 (-) Transcript_21820:66-521(-)|eukprot:CAMPEP_0119172846 /NCGR_PEP_ID=MMETSP1315-20130426/30537_1 /TAXON_ID=676789 /ORGANISM="Prasinoderma singularis, Strain RCC927" /LENGTH=151 /DNA_ID=CAMNT_0007166757 /DNA_START=231 /DNA_END=686 /DNA_ORIENTATION=-
MERATTLPLVNGHVGRTVTYSRYTSSYCFGDSRASGERDHQSVVLRCDGTYTMHSKGDEQSESGSGEMWGHNWDTETSGSYVALVKADGGLDTLTAVLTPKEGTGSAENFDAASVAMQFLDGRGDAGRVVSRESRDAGFALNRVSWEYSES